jgi:hypothetical protein
VNPNFSVRQYYLRHHDRRRWLASLRSSAWLALLIGSAPVFAQDATGTGTGYATAASKSDGASAVSALVQRYPAATIGTVETADQALSEVATVRAAVDSRFTEDQRLCFSKFFVASCVEDAKERRRHALAQVRPIEVQANQFKRRAVVIERDQALADKRAEELRDAPQRAAQQHEYEHTAAEKAQDRAQRAADVEANDKLHATDAAQREAAHQTKLGSVQAKQAAAAQQRANNAAAFERKRLKSSARQREIAIKKADKDRQRASKTTVPPAGAPAASAPAAVNPASVPAQP